MSHYKKVDFFATFFNAKKSFWDYTTTMKVGDFGTVGSYEFDPCFSRFYVQLERQEKFAESAVGSQLLLGIRVEPA